MDFSSLLVGKNFVLLGGVFALTTTLRSTFKPFFDMGMGERLLPLVPLILGILGALMGISENAPEVADKVGVGLIAGFSAGHLFKLGKTSVLGYGVTKKAPKKPEDALPEGDPAAEDPAADGGVKE
jgi:hypothetical protein